MKLTGNNVEHIFKQCLLLESEKDDMDDALKIEGVVHTFGIHPRRVKEHEKEIIEMLSCLPDPFHEDKGGGWSFLNACNDNEDNQWTGLHLIMEELFVLGIAIGKVRCLMPKSMWEALPGGMPYYVVTK